MNQSSSDALFVDDIPRFYDSILVPLIFRDYAQDIAARTKALAPRNVLEVACGTGVVTRELASTLPEGTNILATDLNESMVSYAKSAGTIRPVQWGQADAMDLHFDDASFDAVVCQFGAMFFPDRVAAYRNMHRVLRPNGSFLFNVWGSIQDNELADVITNALAVRYPANPPRFLARTPYGYASPERIETDIRAAGFSECDVSVMDAASVCESADIAATAFCYGTPLRSEIEEREPGGLPAATSFAAAALREKFGPGAVRGSIKALVIRATR